MLTDKIYFIFENTRTVVRAEHLCRENRIYCQIFPVPREASSDCAMCLVISQPERLELESKLKEAGICFRVWPESPAFDLLSLVEEGGCAAKLPAKHLRKALESGLPEISELGSISQTDPLPEPQESEKGRRARGRLLVGTGDFDDAGVYLINEEQALIETVDFFPPVCSDPYMFGQIAAANALNDVFAMGGEVLTAMNIVMFPAQGVPLSVLGDILRGGRDKVREAGGVVVGGHTITDRIPKYGLAVTGVVRPQSLVTNRGAVNTDVLLLTKPLGTGVMLAGRKVGLVNDADYGAVLEGMRQLNLKGARLMRKFEVKAATDITGFGLLGHALNIARGSGVTLEIEASKVPAYSGVKELLEKGCIPGAVFSNSEYLEDVIHPVSHLSTISGMLLSDPQTCGGLLICVPEDKAESLIKGLQEEGYPHTRYIGRVLDKQKFPLILKE